MSVATRMQAIDEGGVSVGTDTIENPDKAGQAPTSACDRSPTFVVRGPPSGNGRIRLPVPADEPLPTSDIELARLAGRAEPVFEVLERWWEMPFDLVPLDAAAGDCTGALPIEIRIDAAQCGTTTPAPEVVVQLPMSSLDTLAALPALLPDELRIRGEPLSARVELSRMMLPGNQLAHLGPGSLLLLQESFDKRWKVRVQLPGITLAATLDVEREALSVAGTPLRDSAPEKSASCVQVILDGDLQLDPMALAGQTDYPSSLSRVFADGRCRVAVNGWARHQGSLLRVGDGHGMLIDTPDGSRLVDHTATG